MGAECRTGASDHATGAPPAGPGADSRPGAVYIRLCEYSTLVCLSVLFLDGAIIIGTPERKLDFECYQCSWSEVHCAHHFSSLPALALSLCHGAFDRGEWATLSQVLYQSPSQYSLGVPVQHRALCSAPLALKLELTAGPIPGGPGPVLPGVLAHAGAASPALSGAPVYLVPTMRTAEDQTRDPPFAT